MEETSHGNEFERKVFEVLMKTGVQVITEPAIEGTRPDFLLKFEDGTSAVIEAKAWTDTPGTLADAKKQIKYYKKITGTEHAFVVMPQVRRSFDKEIVSIKDLSSAITTLGIKARTAKATVSRSLTLRYSIKAPKIMAVMPFTASFNDVFFVAMTYAAKSVGAACTRVDRERFTGDIVLKIKKDLRESMAVIADITRANPNVLYEVGFAHAIKKPTVHICSSPLKKLPFDVRNWNTIPYRKGQTHALRRPLAAMLKASL